MCACSDHEALTRPRIGPGWAEVRVSRCEGGPLAGSFATWVNGVMVGDTLINPGPGVYRLDPGRRERVVKPGLRYVCDVLVYDENGRREGE